MTGPRLARAAVALLWLLHAGQCLRLFPDWSAIVDDRPILAVDHALHLYHGSLGSFFLKEGLATWGYDPAFMAGYPKTPFHDPSAALSDFSQFVAGGGYRPAAYKLGLLAALLTWPILFFAGTRLVGIDLAGATVATALAAIYFWLDYPKALLDSGLYGFLWAIGWVALLLGLTTRWHQRPNARNWLGLTVAASIAFWVHPTMTAMAAPPLIGCFLVSWPSAANRMGWLGTTMLAAAVAVVCNLSWIVPMIRFWPLRGPQFHFMTAPDDEPWFFASFYLPQSAARMMAWLGKLPAAAVGAQPADNWLLTLLIAGATLGVLQWLWTGRRAEAASFGLAIAWLFALTFFGSLFEVGRSLEPLRYQVPLHLLACVPLGELLAASAALLLRRLSAAAATWSATAAFAVLVWPCNFMLGDSARELSTRPFPVGATPEVIALVDWIKANTDNSARILFEDQLRLRERTVPESLHWSPLLPIWTGRQFIGGQYQCTPLVHHFASFGDFELGRRPIERLAPAEVSGFCDLYNVGWVICWSPKARAVFDWHEGVEKIGELPRVATPGLKPAESRLSLYRFKRKGSYFARGQGQVVAAGPNRIELAALEPDRGEIVVRYHWFDRFVADPPTPIERAAADPDPVGFIRIRTATRIERLTIRVDY